MQLFFLVCLNSAILVSVVNSRECWQYSDMEYEGRIDNSDKIQVTCSGNFCMTLSEQGSDFNVYNGSCPDPTVAITDCQTNGVGCKNEKLRDVYVKVCCCDSDLCNHSGKAHLLSVFTFMSAILMM